MIQKYLMAEKAVVEYVKELAFLVLVIVLAYRLVTEVPVEGPFDESARGVLLIFGYAMIPGMFLKIYVVVKEFLGKKAS